MALNWHTLLHYHLDMVSLLHQYGHILEAKLVVNVIFTSQHALLRNQYCIGQRLYDLEFYTVEIWGVTPPTKMSKNVYVMNAYYVLITDI